MNARLGFLAVWAIAVGVAFMGCGKSATAVTDVTFVVDTIIDTVRVGHVDTLIITDTIRIHSADTVHVVDTLVLTDTLRIPSAPDTIIVTDTVFVPTPDSGKKCTDAHENCGHH